MAFDDETKRNVPEAGVYQLNWSHNLIEMGSERETILARYHSQVLTIVSTKLTLASMFDWYLLLW